MQHRGMRLVTTPIFYVNSRPHIGHLYSMVVADTYTRYLKLTGHSTLMITGTDEHGLKIQQAAASSNVPISQFVDENSQMFQQLASRASIAYDDFVRTSENRHRQAVQTLWETLYQKQFIYLDQYEGWYSQSEEAFIPENSLPEDPKAAGLIWISEPNYKFRLSHFRQKLIDWLETEPISPTFYARDLCLDLKSNGVEDISISRLREKINWAIPVPNDENHSVYVWLDALTNYLTVSGYPDQKQFEQTWPADVHIIGKDIVKFHALYWPAFLMAADLPLPRRILTHGHWLMDNVKMSKSLGNVVCPFELLEKYGPDPVRYYLCKASTNRGDSNFCEITMRDVVNADLADSLGNLLSRSCRLLPQDISYPRVESIHDKSEIQDKIEQISQTFDAYMTEFDTSTLVKQILLCIHRTNAYFVKNEPWKLSKDASARNQLLEVLMNTFETIRIAAVLLSPIMPTKMSELLRHLGFKDANNGYNLPFGDGYKRSEGIQRSKKILFAKY